jgi:transposase
MRFGDIFISHAPKVRWRTDSRVPGLGLIALSAAALMLAAGCSLTGGSGPPGTNRPVPDTPPVGGTFVGGTNLLAATPAPQSAFQCTDRRTGAIGGGLEWAFAEKVNTIGKDNGVDPVPLTPRCFRGTPEGGAEMGRTRPPYSPEFRQEALRLLRSGDRSPKQLAGELGCTEQTLRNWLRQDEADRGERSDVLTSEERRRLRELERENRVLRQEREILKRAAAFFARESEGPR